MELELKFANGEWRRYYLLAGVEASVDTLFLLEGHLGVKSRIFLDGKPVRELIHGFLGKFHAAGT